MKTVLLALLTLLLLTQCTHTPPKKVSQSDREVLLPEPDKAEREAYEHQQKLLQSKCVFMNPDTSVVGVKIRDVESTLRVLGKLTELQGDSTHVFYSRDMKQQLGLTVHPGDYYSQVSIFQISYANKATSKGRQLPFKEFVTEKGIKLGISKSQLIQQLGACYMAKDSTKQGITLHYRLEHPNDSKTKLLSNNNMPIYYAVYQLTHDQLVRIEFGFEYP